MSLTRSFKKTIRARAQRDGAFRDALLREAVDRFLAGEMDVGKAVLRDYINATIGFERLAAETGSSSKSLMRMLSPAGNPRADNLFAILRTVQDASGMRLAVATGSE
jgi:DNA-binding phage protein